MSPLLPFSSPPTPSATSTKQGKLLLTNDLGGTATAPTVVATHLASPLPVLQGGTGVTTSTGTGSVVLSNTPTLTTAVLGSSTATTQAPADNSTKVATTAYVDNAILGQNFKEACKYASTTALPSVVYSNGSSGVGATLTAVAVGAISLDGSSPSVGDRVLIKNQASSFQNGIYTVTVTGSGIAVFVLTRATDADQSTDFKTGDSLFITSGSTLSATTWAYTGIDNPTIGTDDIPFVQVAGQGSFTAGNGISITGTSIAIDTSVTVDKTTAQTLTNKTLTSPILTTPTLGVATATSINKVAITAPATSATLTIADGQTLTVNGSATITNGTHSGTNTGDVTLTTIGSSANANGASLSGQQLQLQPASASFGGVLTTGTQTIAGAKTFTSATKINANSTTAFVVEQDGVNDNTLVVDTTNNRLGFNVDSPSSFFHIRIADSSASVGQLFSNSMIVENSGNTYIQLMGGASSEKSINFAKPTNGADGAIKYNYTGANGVANGFGFWANGNSFKAAIDSNGRIGIGVATPTNELSFANGANRKAWIENSATDVVGRQLTIAAGGTVAGTSVSDVNGGGLVLQAGLGTGAGTSVITFQTGTPLGTGTTLQTMTTQMTLSGTSLTLTDTINIVVGTSTGTKIGTSTSQKLGFFNATPVVQQGATTDLGTVLSTLGLRAAGTAYPITTSGAVSFTGGVTIATTNLTITDKDIALGTTTGTKIGTATNQKMGFYNATPIVQPDATTDLGTVLSNLGLRAAGTAYPITTSGAATFNGNVTLGDDSGDSITVNGTPSGLIESGTYTPGTTNVTNIASSTANAQTMYLRVGNVVTVAGTIVIDPTATGASEVGVDLPFATNFGAATQCGGTFANQTTTGSVGCIIADATNDRARFLMNVVDIASRTYAFTFTYRII